MSVRETVMQQPKVLIVDDSPDKVLALEVVLEELQVQVVRAYSGREALRQVLNNEFAVILLDVNMPDMDGFETASMIRTRRSSSQTPIIFITSFGDEMHAARGYSLGAVDYILAPVLPDVLRTKVLVFVELFRKSQQLREQAEALSRRASQQQRLAATALAVNHSSGSIEATLQTISDAACHIIGTDLCVAILNADTRVRAGYRSSDPLRVASARAAPATATSTQYLALDGVVEREVSRAAKAVVKVPRAALVDHPELTDESTNGVPRFGGEIIASPLIGRDGQRLGLLYIVGANDAVYSADDEAVLIQLTQLAAITIENTIFTRDRDANRLKDEFLATLSHELRTPLSAILGWSELLKRRRNADDVDRGIEVIQRSVRSQMKLIEDLLDVSRINSGKLKTQMKEIRLHEVVSASVDALRLTADAKGIRIDVKFFDQEDEVFGDPDRLQQVVSNLIGNSIKFSPANSQIRVEVQRDRENVAVRIQDQGCGIDPAFLPYVFDRFRQADSSNTRSHGGLGIGLAIVRHIVELHRGSVAAHSDGKGRGATFTVVLPLRVASQNKNALSNGHGGSTLSSLETAALEGLRVIIVDDEADSRGMLSAALRDAGCSVTEAGSVADAYQAFIGSQPDVVISDIGMPGENGFDLIGRIRDLPPEKGGCVPAIALTAYVREEDRHRALSAGFQHHIGKPVELTELMRLVSGYAEKADEVSATR